MHTGIQFTYMVTCIRYTNLQPLSLSLFLSCFALHFVLLLAYLTLMLLLCCVVCVCVCNNDVVSSGVVVVNICLKVHYWTFFIVVVIEAIAVAIVLVIFSFGFVATTSHHTIRQPTKQSVNQAKPLFYSMFCCVFKTHLHPCNTFTHVHEHNVWNKRSESKCLHIHLHVHILSVIYK